MTNGVSDTLSVKNNDCLSLILPKEDRDIKAHLALHRYVIAPINEGDKLGEIIFTDNGTELGRVELVAQFGVPSIKKKTILDKIKDKLF